MKLQNGKSGLTKTNSQSGLNERISSNLVQALPIRQPLGLKDRLLIIALIAAVFLSYYPAWHGGFLWDDNGFVTRSELRSWYGLFRIWFDLKATEGYYPLLHSAFWIQYWLWGDATLGYHLVNIMLHAMSAVMVALILRRLAIPGAFLAAAIFALHPVHVESVAWISELKNTLSAVFYLGSVMVYLRFDEQRRMLPYLWSLLLFLLAMLSKPVTVTLPGALLVIFWWQRGRLSWVKDVLPLLPFFLLAAVFGIDTIWTQNLLAGGSPEFNIPAWGRVLIAGKAICFYLGKLFWPSPLIFIYPRWETSQVAAWQYMFPVAAFALLVTLWMLRRHWRGPLAGLLFFVGTLFPVLGFFNVVTFVYSFVADHYQYLASLGIIILFAAGIATLLKRLRFRVRLAGYAICLLLLVTLAALTWRQSRMYTDIITLYQTTLSNNPQCLMAHNNLGIALDDSGRASEAISQFQYALLIKPDSAEFHNNLGIALNDSGRIGEAISQFRYALLIKPDSAEFHNNLGVALANDKQIEKAIAQFRYALLIKPGSAEFHNNLGVALIELGKINEAVTHFEKALQIQPDLTDTLQTLEPIRRKEAEFHNNLGLALIKLGKINEAVTHFEKALQIQPDLAAARRALETIRSKEAENSKVKK
ncbi:MAG: tetratricopeptide repeat protein [Smithella sp.]